jgi:hypothetical protein
MKTDVLLILGGINDLQYSPLARAILDQSLKPHVIRLGARFAIEGTPSHRAMTTKYGPSDEDNGLAMIADQGRLLDGCIKAGVGDGEYRIVAAVFGVERIRTTDEWNWVESLLDDDVPLYWHEMCADGTYQLNSDDGTFGNAIRIHAA